MPVVTEQKVQNNNNNKTNENKEYKFYKNMNKNKKSIKLTESDLHNIIEKSVNKVLKEASYDSNSNFDEESHNSDLRNRFKSTIESVLQSKDDALRVLSYIQGATTDESLKNKSRIVINDLLKSDELAQQVYRLVKADGWDVNENKSLKQKNAIKLTEEDLHFIIKESVTKILEENFNIKKTTDKIKKGVKNFGNGIKDGLKKVKQKYDDEVERVLNAPNPLYDDDEEFDESDN